MTGATNLEHLIQNMEPHLHPGAYVFVTVMDLSAVDRNDTLMEFKENEGTTLVMAQNKADASGLPYDYVAAWITLKVHSSLEAVGLTAAFAGALAQQNLSCNVLAGYYHDHIFVARTEAAKAMEVLQGLASSFS